MSFGCFAHLTHTQLVQNRRVFTNSICKTCKPLPPGPETAARLTRGSLLPPCFLLCVHVFLSPVTVSSPSPPRTDAPEISHNRNTLSARAAGRAAAAGVTVKTPVMIIVIKTAADSVRRTRPRAKCFRHSFPHREWVAVLNRSTARLLFSFRSYRW